jgi:NDP-sugar pyrophosphorylase family protein
VGRSAFIDLLLGDLAAQGATEVVLSLADRADAVEARLRACPPPPGIRLRVVREPEPLGTGGALLHAVTALGLEGRVYVLNGDTHLPGGLAEFDAALSARGNVIALARVADVSRFGTVETGAGGVVRGFREKSATGEGWVYSGLARLATDSLAAWRSTSPISLERDILPALAREGRLRAKKLRSEFIDIGVPEDYERFLRTMARK